MVRRAASFGAKRGRGGYVRPSLPPAGVAPTITVQPVPPTGITEPNPATFSVTATGTAPLLYQWQRNSVDIPGATSSSYTLSPTSVSDTGAVFRCIVNNVTGIPAYSNAVALTVTAGSVVSASALTFFDLPSLQDERDTYDLLGWERTAGDEAFNFNLTDPGALTAANVDLHGDTEGDDLWTWDAQVTRGYSGIATTYRDRWLGYFKDGHYRGSLPLSSDTQNGDNGWCCHTFGWGLIRYGMRTGDTACITEAELIADYSCSQQFGSTTAPGTLTSNYAVASGGGRDTARLGILIAYLAHATGKSKWMAWLRAYIDAYLGSVDYQSATVVGHTRGAYFSNVDWMYQNGQYRGWSGTTYYDYSNGGAIDAGTAALAAYADGVRSNSAFFYALHNEFLWRAYLVTGRADVRTRIIECARFLEYFAHDPLHTAAGGPFIGAFYGWRGATHWHREYDATWGSQAQYDVTALNTLIAGYKLTGDSALLTKARGIGNTTSHLRQATRWAEGRPLIGQQGPQVPANEVWRFVDTSETVTGSQYFANNKGMLQYCYQVFENGGEPPTLNSNVPAYISGLAEGAATVINSRYTDITNEFTGRSSTPLYAMTYSGGAYDTRRGEFLFTGGGHSAFNGNGVWGIKIYDAAPTWRQVTQHASWSPGSYQPAITSAVENCDDGSPGANHTYCQLVYDAYSDSLVKFATPAMFNDGGGGFGRIRRLNLATGAWNASTGAAGTTSQAYMNAGTCSYDSAARAIWGVGGFSEGTWNRYDCVANTIDIGISVSGAPGGSFGIDTASAIDPVRRYMIVIGGNKPGPRSGVNMVVADLSSYNATTRTMTAYSAVTPGYPAALNVPKVGVEFHPPSGTFVAWVGGNILYRLIPPSNPFTGTWTFSTVTPSGTALPANSSGVDGNGYDGVYSRFRWAPYPNDPSRGVFVMMICQGSMYVQPGLSVSGVHVYKPNF